MEIFSAHPMVLVGDIGQVEACFGLLEDSVNLGARFAPECTTGMEIFLSTPDGTSM
jgi:hypothetical protein